MIENIRLYADGAEYDLIYNDGAAAFWLAQAQRYGGPVLELACGTGTNLLPIARAGFDAAGIDLSPAMLETARQKARAAGLSLAWLEADMRAFDLQRQFRFVFLASNTLCHLLDNADFSACMAAVQRHLAPAGRFMIDVFVPNVRLLARPPEIQSTFAIYDDPAGRGQVEITYTAVYEPDTQINRIRMHYQYPWIDEPVEADLPMRIYFPQELDALLRCHGFEIEAKYGDRDLSPFSAASPQQIYVLRAP
ncbi:MAG: class I SAM-dependent methyltransferase [Caldilineaceae bacterium]|nr:class I SAM-dependent methyltransferase [Caldilineaceae bacterium]